MIGNIEGLIPLIAAVVFAAGNTAAYTGCGYINNRNTRLKYFLQGASVGFALGCVWFLTGPAYSDGAGGVLGSAGKFIHTTLTVYAAVQTGIVVLGMAGSTIHADGKGAARAGKLFLGNFYLDENGLSGGIIQGLLRHTWEMPQSLIGHGYSQARNVFGHVSRVDFWNGATFVSDENKGRENGVSLGNFIALNIDYKITGNFDEHALSTSIFRHEYGHTFDSRIFGWFYLFVIGIPSIISAAGTGNHAEYWTERRADRHAKKMKNQQRKSKIVSC